MYLSVESGALDVVELIGALRGGTGGRRGRARSAAPSIPRREDRGAQPTYEQRVLAARIRIDNQQRRPRVKTPEWIVELAKGNIGQ